jgi:secernin
MGCDTMIALPKATKDGSIILAKNSDRQPNEAHHVLSIQRATHSTKSMVDCTYISIPQVRETYAALLFKPWWIWGAEMGINEFGVAIGNEGKFFSNFFTSTTILFMITF